MNYYRQGPFRPSGAGAGFGVPGLTPYIKAIMIACGAVWLIQIALAKIWGFPLHAWLGLVPGAVFTQGSLWQPLTYMWLHSTADLFHLVFNMLMLWMFGGELERYWGSRAFLRFYVVCGIGGGVAAALMGLASPAMRWVPVIGASGAIFGLFMAYGIIFAERTILFMLIFPMKARTMAIIMAGLTLFYTISAPNSGVSYAAHLGGAVVGFLYLKRVWRFGDFLRELRWKVRRRRFKVMPPDEKDDFDRWVN